MNQAPTISDGRIDFNEFCKANYVEPSCEETICKEKSEKVINILKGDPTLALAQDPFYNWIKRKGFALTSYPHLGLREALCVSVVTNDPDQTLWRRVAIVEDFYDIITKFHCTKSGHRSAEITSNEINKQYDGIPRSAVDKYIELCSICHLNAPVVCQPVSVEKKEDASTTTKYFMKKGQIEIVDLFEKPLGSFPKIGLYIDVFSNYHVLFPLVTSEQADIAVKLRRFVFPYFGVPCYLYSSIGYDFIDSLLEYTCIHWPDASFIRNGCRRTQQQKSNVVKRARKSKRLIASVFESCRDELEGVELTTTSCADLLLSIQYQLNITSCKSSHKSAFEHAFGIPPQDTSYKELIDTTSDSSSDEYKLDKYDEEWVDLSSKKCSNKSNKVKHTVLNRKDHNTSENITKDNKILMNRLMQKSSSQQSSQKIQHMLSLSSIQAQEQQVTSLRELLHQEENRLEMLKKMRGLSSGSKLSKAPSESTQRSAVIRSSETGRHLSNGSQPAMSSRLQQLVDSVAIDQMNSKYSNTLNQSSDKQGKSSSPEVITITDSPSPASPPALISTNNVPGVIQGPSNHSSSRNIKLDETVIMKSIESSRRYRDFVMKQNNIKRNFQKQIDKKIAGFPYPKTFRQVWPIIPVQDPSFVKNLGLETVTQFFDQSGHVKSPSTSKVKPICNQCGCDFASAWQIRKNNSKQVLLCESCDFTNLKLLQRTKLATQLKEVVESLQKEDEKFNTECDEARKQIVAAERTAVITNAQKSLNNNKSGQWQQTSSDSVIQSSILPGKGSSLHEVKSLDVRKRRSDQDYVVPQRKSTKIASHVDHTLNRITQHLLRKQVDEKVQQHRQRHSPSPITSTRTPPSDDVEIINNSYKPRSSEVIKSMPPPLTSVSSSGDSRRSRRKGQPRQNRQLSNSSDI